MGNRERFNLAYYESLITKAEKTLRIMDSETHADGLILRHDIDLSLHLAYEFSRIEHRIGIRSTYHFLLTSESYNIFSRMSIQLLRKMAGEGFEIGLHFDPRAHGNISQKEMSRKLWTEISIMETLFGFAIYSYSLHNPASWPRGKPETSKLINAYDKRIFGDDRYISDSNLCFRGKDPEKWVEKSKMQLVQFVTHPMQYF